MSVRLAIDIGGTFTDATLIDEETGEVSIAKVLTTPSDPSEGFMQAAERALAEGSVEAGDVTFVVHATTVATNAIIEGKIARSGFVTTDGFRDLLEIARQVRPTLYDTQFEKAAPLVPRDRAVVVGGAARPEGRGAATARGRLRARRGRDPPARGRRVGRRLPAARVRQPRARAARRRDPRRGAARDPDLALVGGGARVPRVPAGLDDRDQRGHPARRRALPAGDREPARRGGRAGEAARDAVERRHLRLRCRRRAARVHGRVGPGRGRDRLGPPRRDARAARHPLVRHGRHDGEGRADPGRPAVGDEGLQRRRPRGRGDRRHVALRLPGADARSSTSSRSAPAAARSRGSTRAGCSASGRRARAPTPAPSVTAAAASSRP